MAATTSWELPGRLSLDAEERVRLRNTLRSAGRFVLLRDRLILEGSADYDFKRKELLQAHAKAQWNVQCCKIRRVALAVRDN